MYVFGISMPVAEILFVVLLLFIVALVIILVQLGKMARHIRVLDETTLEIRRYEEAEEVTLRTSQTNAGTLTAAERRRVQSLGAPAAKLEATARKRLLSGARPEAVKAEFLGHGVREEIATRAVNDASYWIDRFCALDAEQAKAVEAAIRAASKR